jgi:hypothetical protein
MLPWFIRNPAALAEVREAVTSYPDLRVVEGARTIEILGTFPVMHDSAVLDRFQIRIDFPNTYPRDMPYLTEVGGRIPRTVDRHVFPKSGIACLQVPEEWLLGPNRSFRHFLEVPARNYFLGQALVELGNPWPFGERDHGVGGLYQSYGEAIGENDPETTERMLSLLAMKDVKGHHHCPCGSKKRLRDCCIVRVRTLQQKIEPAVAKAALTRLRSYSKGAGSKTPRGSS